MVADVASSRMDAFKINKSAASKKCARTASIPHFVQELRSLQCNRYSVQPHLAYRTVSAINGEL